MDWISIDSPKENWPGLWSEGLIKDLHFQAKPEIWYQLTRQSIAAMWSQFLSWLDLSGFPTLSPSPTHILSERSMIVVDEETNEVGGGV